MDKARLRAAVVLFLLCSSGCQYLFGIDTRQEKGAAAVETPDAEPGEELDAESEAATPTGCELPTEGDAHLRFGNMTPGLDLVDFCVKPASAPSYGSTGPLTRGVGLDCPDGIPYQRILAPVGVAPGRYTIKVVDSDAPDCEQAGSAELDNVQVRRGDSLTILRIGGGVGDEAESVRAYREHEVATLGTSLLRFIHALSGADRVDVGLPDTEGNLGYMGFPNVDYGDVAPAGSMGDIAKVEADGYISLFAADAWLTFVLATDEQTTPLARRRVQIVYGRAATLLAVGAVGNTDFPPQMITCQDSRHDGPWTECSPSAVDVSVTTIEAMLDGAGAPGIRERRPYVIDAIAHADSDVICVANVCDPRDKEAIVKAAVGGYPYSYHEVQDLSTQVDDPADIHGGVPPAFEGPACAGTELEALAKEGIACAAEFCSLTPGDPHSEVTSTGCLMSNCLTPFVQLLYNGDPRYKVCYNCIGFSLAGFAPLDETLTACTTGTREVLAYNGNNCQLILSRLPLSNTETWTVGSSSYRTSFSRARVTLSAPNEGPLDVYCTVLTTAARDPATLPYTSSYGEGEAGNAWTNENRLQIEKLKKYVKERSVGYPSVVMGAFYVGPGLVVDGVEVLSSPKETLPSFESLREGFGLGVARSWPWQCTECANNPWYGEGDTASGSWTTHILLQGIPSTDVLETRRLFEELVVPLPNDTTGLGPISPRYGLRSVIRVPR